MTRKYADAAAVGMHAPNLARETAALADEYEMVGTSVDMLIKVGPFGGLIAAAIPLALQLMANHKMIDARQVVGANIVPPEVLEAQMKAEVIQMQAESMRAQQQAMEDMREAEAAFLRAQMVNNNEPAPTEWSEKVPA